jgi:SAM-dependent methyltransferase
MLTKNTVCRDCASAKLTLFLDLSDQPPANAFLTKEALEEGNEEHFPLRAYVCEDCQLVQLTDVVDVDTLFQNYVYFTAGAGPTTPKHFTEYAQSIARRFQLTKDSFVVELGSNDGLLLSAFQELGIKRVLGIDPAKNVAQIANERGVLTIAEEWNETRVKQIAAEHGKADMIIGNNVVAHINDHQGLVRGVKALLAPSGVFVFEAPYLVDMFENLSYDTIYHEHLSCLALRPLKRMFESHGLEIFDIEVKSVQGVSIRVFVGWPGAHEVSARVGELIHKEEQMNLHHVDAYHVLARRVEERMKELTSLLAQLKQEGKTIAGYGAPAKGNTLLNYTKIGPDTLDYLTEELPTKVGKFSPGMHIPVVHIEDARKNPPDYFLVLAWNYLEKILEREDVLRKHGTKFIVPIGERLEIF